MTKCGEEKLKFPNILPNFPIFTTCCRCQNMSVDEYQSEWLQNCSAQELAS